MRKKQGGKERARTGATLGNHGAEEPDNGSDTAGPQGHGEEAKGFVGGYKRPVSTRNDVARGDGEDGSNEIGTGRHTEAEGSSKTHTKPQAGDQPTPPTEKDLTRTQAEDLKEKDNGTVTHTKTLTEGQARDDDTKTLTERHGKGLAEAVANWFSATYTQNLTKGLAKEHTGGEGSGETHTGGHAKTNDSTKTTTEGRKQEEEDESERQNTGETINGSRRMHTETDESTKGPNKAGPSNRNPTRRDRQEEENVTEEATLEEADDGIQQKPQGGTQGAPQEEQPHDRRGEGGPAHKAEQAP